MRIATFSLLTSIFLTSACWAQKAKFEELPINDLYCSQYEGKQASCEAEVKRMEVDNRKAWQGDYQGQRNVAYCLGSGCNGMVVTNQLLSCAWRIVIIGSGNPKVDTTDIGNIRVTCGRLDRAELSVARAQAAAIFQRVYVRKIPPVAW